MVVSSGYTLELGVSRTSTSGFTMRSYPSRSEWPCRRWMRCKSAKWIIISSLESMMGPLLCNRLQSIGLTLMYLSRVLNTRFTRKSAKCSRRPGSGTSCHLVGIMSGWMRRLILRIRFCLTFQIFH